MSLNKSFVPFLAALCLLFITSVARADTDNPPLGAPAMGERCRDNPDKCREAKERMQNWCKDNAERCEEMKQRREKMREECKKDPEACQKKRAEMREKFRQRMEQKCKQNPERCEEWKQRHRRGDGPPHDGPDDKAR